MGLNELIKGEAEWRKRKIGSEKTIELMEKGLLREPSSLINESLFCFGNGEAFEMSRPETEYLKSLYLINLAQYYQTQELIELLKENPKF